MEVDNFITGLTDELEPLRKLAMRLRLDGSQITENGVAYSNRPHIAPQAYALKLYLPLSEATTDRYQRIHGIIIPPHYLKILKKLNGAYAFELSLFGLPRSMTDDPPLINRSVLQPYDVANANQDWKSEYDVPVEWFHFGGGPYSFDENIGYFFDEYGTIYSTRKSGERLNSWTSFREFLSDELRRTEVAYPEYEAFMAEIMGNQRSQKPWWKKLFKQ